MKLLPLLILCFTTVAVADDFKLVNGKEYKNVTVTRVEPDGIVPRTKSGISKIYFIELPEDVKKRFITTWQLPRLIPHNKQSISRRSLLSIAASRSQSFLTAGGKHQSTSRTR
jgi:hypothetical protein